jgi:hypothetical protein
MLKTLVLPLSLVGFLSVGSAVAEDKMDKMGSMKCTDADIATMETKMKGMMDTDKQKWRWARWTWRKRRWPIRICMAARCT